MIVLLGMGLRFYQLGAQSLWFDELFSRRAALAPTLWAAIERGSIKDMFPPIYPAIAYEAVRLPLGPEAALRLPSAVGGVLAIFATYLLGQVLVSVRVGLIAAACMACHWFAVSYSQEGRPYALLLFVASVTSYLAIQLVRAHRAGRSTRGWLLALGAWGLVACYFHYAGLVFFALSGAVLLAAGRRQLAPVRAVFLTYLAVGLAFLPWVSVVLAQIGRRLTNQTPPRLSHVMRTFSLLCATHPGWMVLLVAAGMWASHQHVKSTPTIDSVEERRYQSRTFLTVVGLWIVLTTTAIWIFSHAVVPIYTHRNMIMVLPACVLLFSWAANNIDLRWFNGRPVAAVMLVAGLLFDLLVVKSTYAEARKEPFRQITEIIAKESAKLEPDRVAVWAQPAWVGPFLNEYFELQGTAVRFHPSLVNQPELQWIVTRDAPLAPPAGCVPQEILRHEPDRRIPWPGRPMALYRCASESSP
ncbi:MAG: glycosyltransferase family 39 protein [Myxococcales bacterium]